MKLEGSSINWRVGLFFLYVHAIALLALLPWFFSWTGVVLFVAGIFLFGTIGMSVGYHRLFTHRGFTCPRWLECTIAVLGSCCGEEAPAFWVAVHRKHHHHSDGDDDPHSPLLRGFFWSHVGWLLVKNDDLHRYTIIDRYARDLQRDPFQAWLVRHDHWVYLFFTCWLLLFAAGFGALALMGAPLTDAVQFGLSLMIWGGALRTVIVWHQTWFVNSGSHLWGYRNYETRDDSRNNVWGGLLCNGDGWHNNHHADPNAARHGHRRWELDLSWLTIRLLMALGLAKNVVLPSPAIAARFAAGGPQAAPEASVDDDFSLAPDLAPLPPAVRVAAVRK